MQARSRTFRSSRTLPSQGAAARSRSAAGVRPASGLPEALGRLPDERRGQVRDVFAPLAQRRQLDLDDVEAVVEVASEPAGGDLRAQVAVGGRNARARSPGATRASRPGAPRPARARAAAWPARSAAARRFRRGTACRRPRASNSPGLFSVAPVNAPRTWPNSSLSNSDSTTAEQLTVTNRRSRRGPVSCSARATSSLPVPVSPVISAVRTCGASRRIVPNSSCIGRPAPDHAGELQPPCNIPLHRQEAAPALESPRARRPAAARGA